MLPRHFTAANVGVLIVNVAIVGYLVVQSGERAKIGRLALSGGSLLFQPTGSGSMPLTWRLECSLPGTRWRPAATRPRVRRASIAYGKLIGQDRL
jgi:hypothetical protein